MIHQEVAEFGSRWGDSDALVADLAAPFCFLDAEGPNLRDQAALSGSISGTLVVNSHAPVLR